MTKKEQIIIWGAFVISFIIFWAFGWWVFSTFPPPKYQTVCQTEYWVERRFGRDKFLSSSLEKARKLAGDKRIYSKPICWKVEE